LAFTVVDQEVVSIQYQFRAGDDVIDFGQGRVDLSFSVDDGPASCAEGESQCLGSQLLQSCVDGVVVEAACGADTPVCEAGACVSSASVSQAVVCSEDGSLVCFDGTPCCNDLDGAGQQCTDTCVQNSRMQIFACDGPSDCTGSQLCCLYGDPNGLRTQCVGVSGCSAPAPYLAQEVCDPESDSCPGGTTCQPRSSGPMFTCQ
jgi:hypothetical protein